MNAYDVLEVSRLATVDEIKEKFRVLMLKKHPDKQSQQSSSSSSTVPSAIPSSAYQIEKLVKARNILLDGNLRRQLDTQLDSISHFKLKGDSVKLSEFTLSSENDEELFMYRLMCRCGDYYEVSHVVGSYSYCLYLSLFH